MHVYVREKLASVLYSRTNEGTRHPSLVCHYFNSFISHIRFYFENKNRTWHYFIPGNWTSAERRDQRGAQLELKGVEPRTCGLLNQWHLHEELVLVISNSGLHLICRCVAF